jgi:hypothetical protein
VVYAGINLWHSFIHWWLFYVASCNSRSVTRDLPERTLCLVRALKFYMDRTKDPTFHRGRKRLFTVAITVDADTPFGGDQLNNILTVVLAQLR